VGSPRKNGGSARRRRKKLQEKKFTLDFGRGKNRQNDDGIKYVIMGGQKFQKRDDVI